MAAGSSGGVDVPLSSGSFLSNIEQRHKLMSKEDLGTLQIQRAEWLLW